MKSETIKSHILSLLAIGFLIFVFIFTGSFSEGVKNGISICLNHLIPSLFFFMALCSFFTASDIGENMLFFLAKPIAKLFRISKKEATIFSFSLLGGFPIGAKLLSDAVKRKETNPQVAERMLAYCVNCGPAFLISAVSVPIFHNYTIGIVVYLSQFLASLVVGILSSRSIKRLRVYSSADLPFSRKKSDYSRCLIQAVESTIRSMALVCGLVLIFSGCNAVIDSLGIITKLTESLTLIMTEQQALSLLLGLLEVTNGCNALFQSPSLIILILITGFGGLCVQLQIKAMIGGLRLKYFYLYRPLYIFLSWFFSMLLIRLFGGEASVFGIQHSVLTKPFVVSPVFSILLVFLSLSLLLSGKKSGTIEYIRKQKG